MLLGHFGGRVRVAGGQGKDFFLSYVIGEAVKRFLLVLDKEKRVLFTEG